MKSLEKLEGRVLSRHEQQQIIGGSRVVCVCGDGTGFICMGDPIACINDAAGVCAGTGASNCIASD
jgi:hypothetical protein